MPIILEKHRVPPDISEFFEEIIPGNTKDTWTINPQAYPDAHYATFPEALIRPMIEVSTSQKGVCPKCGSQWARIIDSKQIKRKRLNDRTDRHEQDGMNSCGNTVGGTETQTIGWKPTCSCKWYKLKENISIPQPVLDMVEKAGIVTT